MPQFTLGIEEEFQIVDPETRGLKSHISEILAGSAATLQDQVTCELHQSVVEIGTKVCADIAEARREVATTRAALARIAREQGVRIAAAGTHPFTHWSDVETSASERYNRILSDLQVVARANVIFGLHIHVGINDPEKLIHVFNMARYFVPHIMALSVNSPFWCGKETGWKSYRTKVFEKFPRSGIPEAFSSHSEYTELLADLVKTNSITDGKMIWWDIRPHWRFPTLEFRCCDVPMRVDETICLAALCQALVAKLYVLHEKNLSFRLHRRSLIMENKWRAARWGVDGKLIDLGKMQEVETPALIEEIFEFVDDMVDHLGVREEITYFREIVKRGTGADRQLKVWRETGDLKDVVDYVISETEHGLDVG
ncbi:MAG: carboxylate-amine ligase [Planctomycetota bacterium]|nr:carboxylate-amine ligase [Planctomycetota bacterium]